MFESSSRASTKRCYAISVKTLPLSCPLPAERLWDAHPRVYLPIAKKGRVTCPYCGTEYIIRDMDCFT